MPAGEGTEGQAPPAGGGEAPERREGDEGAGDGGGEPGPAGEGEEEGQGQQERDGGEEGATRRAVRPGRT